MPCSLWQGLLITLPCWLWLLFVCVTTTSLLFKLLAEIIRFKVVLLSCNTRSIALQNFLVSLTYHTHTERCDDIYWSHDGSELYSVSQDHGRVLVSNVSALFPRENYVTTRDFEVRTRLTTGWTNGVRFPAGTIFFCYFRVQTGSGSHPASCPMDTWGPFPGGKAAGAWNWPLISI
jgi:hypothetical protein